MTLPILIVSAFPDRLPPLLAELDDMGRKYEIIQSPVGSQATLTGNPYWRDDHNPKLMSWGEVACYEGHWKAWKRVCELGESCIILEDDARILKKLPNALHRTADRDLFYLGYKPMLRIPNQFGSVASTFKGWAPAPFCWWTIGYMLTPSVARSFLNITKAWGGRTIPVDELISAHYTGNVTENRLGLLDLSAIEPINGFVPT